MVIRSPCCKGLAEYFPHAHIIAHQHLLFHVRHSKLRFGKMLQIPNDATVSITHPIHVCRVFVQLYIYIPHCTVHPLHPRTYYMQ